ncbi:hypothetical protein SBDP1_190014 [Syntrophobacter sp. SbD1]|nr:hypothetical protein SBDP1_190014 [Syntrophobacter sp. SbD1]
MAIRRSYDDINFEIREAEGMSLRRFLLEGEKRSIAHKDQLRKMSIENGFGLRSSRYSRVIKEET